MLLSTLRRRWILACILFLVTLAGVGAALFKLPWTYQTTASVLFLQSKNGAKLSDGNPYLSFTPALNQTADVVRYETMDGRTAAVLAQQGYTSTYTVVDAPDTTGPVLNITVTGPDKAGVENTLAGVTKEIGLKLQTLQAGVNASSMIRQSVIAFTPKPTIQLTKKARPLVAVFAVGLILTLGIPQLVDAIAARRQSSRKSPGWDDAYLVSSQPSPAARPERRPPPERSRQPVADRQQGPDRRQLPERHQAPDRHPAPDRQQADRQQASRQRPVGRRSDGERGYRDPTTDPRLDSAIHQGKPIGPGPRRRPGPGPDRLN